MIDVIFLLLIPNLKMNCFYSMREVLDLPKLLFKNKIIERYLI